VTARSYLATDTLTGRLIADDRDSDQVMRAHRARITLTRGYNPTV
jgi:hypothetical protein